MPEGKVFGSGTNSPCTNKGIIMQKRNEHSAHTIYVHERVHEVECVCVLTPERSCAPRKGIMRKKSTYGVIYKGQRNYF